jgi:hypothetical protein
MGAIHPVTWVHAIHADVLPTTFYFGGLFVTSSVILPEALNYELH